MQKTSHCCVAAMRISAGYNLIRKKTMFYGQTDVDFRPYLATLKIWSKRINIHNSVLDICAKINLDSSQ
jgi:hypothetical protein